MDTKIDLARRLRAFAPNEKGNVAMLFALACLVIFPLVGFAIDFSRTIVDKHKLQMMTDSAVLAAAHDAHMTSAEREAVIESYINHLEAELGREIHYEVEQDGEGLVSLTTELRVDTTISKIMGRDYIDVTVRSDAIEGGADIEVAMVLDITGSMSGSRITALKEAAEDLVEIVVQDAQTPYYSKVSIVPYSVAVNVGEYADDVRGNILPGTPITNAAWQVGATRNITGATRANPVVITSNNHGFQNGDRVRITGVSGMTQLNNKIYTVSNVATNTFRLQGVNGSSYNNYSSGGQIRECINNDCEVTVTAEDHGLENGDHVWITGVNGMTQINRTTHQTWTVFNVTDDTFALTGTTGHSYSNYTSGGTAFCTEAGCEYFRFNNASNGAQRLHRISTCATERTGDEAYTDVAASEEPVGRGYMSTANPCPANQIVPLTSDKDDLNDAIDDLVIGGSTAGHMGAAWGYYTLSPEFGAIFPSASRPAQYGRPKLHKFAVFMTDGDFNSSFCQGVLSRTSTAGSGSTADQINCNAQNGTSFAQAQQYCDAMKDAGIRVYTVGFEVPSQTLRDALTECASHSQFAYFANGSAELVSVFQQIGRSINEVRLVK
jgi:Flp pilus assembly protein TadG